MAAISKTQRDVLRRIKRGRKLWYSPILKGVAWEPLSGERRVTKPRQATVAALLAANMLRHADHDFLGCTYELTDAGRRAAKGGA